MQEYDSFLYAGVLWEGSPRAFGAEMRYFSVCRLIRWKRPARRLFGEAPERSCRKREIPPQRVVFRCRDRRVFCMPAFFWRLFAGGLEELCVSSVRRRPDWHRRSESVRIAPGEYGLP